MAVTMGTDRWHDEELLDAAKVSPLAGLAESLGYEMDEWLEVATTALPETLRITSNRNDREWTIQQIRNLGATQLSWLGSNNAFQMPFERGKASDKKSKRMMTILHDSGRITRQEAASMLPVVLLQPQPEQLVLDMCAAPGSKATQIAETIAPSGIVVANEPVSGRLNMLVSNRGRLALNNILISQHDGRHLGRIPPPGFDTIVADVPCTGNATTRKNRNLWWRWTPKNGRALFKLQVDIVARGASLLVPGGKLMLSTCSIDPVENEAVVAELLRQLPYMQLVPIDENLVPGLTLQKGISDWDILDEKGKIVAFDGSLPELPLLKPEHLSPQKRIELSNSIELEEGFDVTKELEIESLLPLCRRLRHQDNDTGGFFVAMLMHKQDATPQGIARTFIHKRALPSESTWQPKLLDHPKPDRHSIFPAAEEIIDEAVSRYKLNDPGWSWWHRGKRTNIAPKMAYERIFMQQCPNKKGNIWPQGTFHPMKIIHVGLPVFTEKKGTWRTRQESIPAIQQHMGDVLLNISQQTLGRLLQGWAPLIEEFTEELKIKAPESGPLLFGCEIDGVNHVVSAWSGARITMMIDDVGKDILRVKLGLPFIFESEEEE
jgi:16S rRNA C967 or C1407 C5-methylase (RsmB/RsmF family)